MTTNREREEHLASVTLLPGVISADTARDVEDARVERIVLKRLARSRLSEWEVAQILCDEAIGADRIPDWLARYGELGYVDDELLAGELVASYRGRKGLGRSAIARELGRRKIADAVAHAALGEINGDEESDLAHTLAAQRLTQLGSLDDTVVRRRLTAFLLRKGYSFETARVAVEAALVSRGS